MYKQKLVCSIVSLSYSISFTLMSLMEIYVLVLRVSRKTIFE